MKIIRKLARQFIIVLSFLLLIPAPALAAGHGQAAPGGLTADEISSGAAILLTLLFAYFPYLNTWYESLDNTPRGGTWKRLIVLGSLLVISGGAYGLSCAGWLDQLFGVQVACTQAGALGLVRAFVLALIANQATFLIAPKHPAVAAMKAARKGTADLGIGAG